MSKVPDWMFMVFLIVGSLAAGVGVMFWLAENGLYTSFLLQLPEYEIDGVLVFMAVALAVSYRSEEGRLCLVFMLSGIAMMIGSHFLLNGLPDFDKQSNNIVDAYVMFGAFFYMGMVLSLSSACVGVLRRDTREHVNSNHK